MLFHPDTTKYWWEYDMVDPITVIITDSATPVTNPQINYDFIEIPYVKNSTTGKDGRATGKVTLLNKNVFYQGENISVKIDFEVGSELANYRLALCPVGEGNNDWITWMYTIKNGTYNLKTSGLAGKGDEQTSTTSGSYKIPPGRYTLYLLNAGNPNGAHYNGRVYATMDITILPENTPTTAPVRGTALIQSLVTDTNREPIEITQTAKSFTEISNPFNYYNVSGKFNVTAEDVARGYVLLEYSFINLPANSEFTFTVDNLTFAKNQTQ
jgi:hypothetical protein